MNFKNVEEMENYITSKMGIPHVNLEGIHVNICDVFISTLVEIFSIYPIVKEAICAIGQEEDITNQINIVNNSDDENLYIKWHNLDDNSLMSLVIYIDSNNHKLIYLALYLPSYLNEVTLEDINTHLEKRCKEGRYPKSCTTFKSLIFHEIGHVLDVVLGISSTRDFLKIIEGYNIKQEISEQATFSTSETLADAFAEYYSSPSPNNIVSKIVNLVNEKYYERANKKSEIFNVSRKYR